MRTVSLVSIYYSVSVRIAKANITGFLRAMAGRTGTIADAVILAKHGADELPEKGALILSLAVG